MNRKDRLSQGPEIEGGVGIAQDPSGEKVLRLFDVGGVAEYDDQGIDGMLKQRQDGNGIAQDDMRRFDRFNDVEPSIRQPGSLEIRDQGTTERVCLNHSALGRGWQGFRAGVDQLKLHPPVSGPSRFRGIIGNGMAFSHAEGFEPFGIHPGFDQR